MEETDVILLWGSNARETHPIYFHHLLKGLENGASLYCVDPRRTSSAKFADVWLGIHVGSDVALANTVGREIIAAGLANDPFIAHATEGYEAYEKHVDALLIPAAALAGGGFLALCDGATNLMGDGGLPVGVVTHLLGGPFFLLLLLREKRRLY